MYTVEVKFDNNENQAKFVSDSFSPSSGADGQPVPMSEPISVNQNFSVSKTLQILVSNVVADDYGNTPAAAYTIVPDNTSYPGKIDSAGDKDVFKLETTNTGITAVRVTGLALGMKPHLRIVAADQTTVLFNANLDPTKEYLLIPLLGLQPGTTVYAELSDQSSTASGGLYEFSSGEKLGSDPFHLLFLPMITLK